jgi:hypothetical protein
MTKVGILRKLAFVRAARAGFLVLLSQFAMAQPPSISLDGASSDGSAISPMPAPPSSEPLNAPTRRDLAAPGVARPIPTPAYEVSIPARSALDVICASLFDDIYSEEAKARWTPLYLRTYFTEGWDTPFVLPTSSSAGAPRQGWVGAFDGQFFRAWFFVFAFDQGVNSHVGNGYLGRYTIWVPFNRRLEFQWDSYFIVSNKGGASNTYHGNIGDQTFWLKTQLCETKNYGYGTGLGLNVPTGRTENGQGLNYLQAGFRFLWFPFGGKWMVRGETGPIIPFASTGHTQYQNVLGVGRYFAGSEESWFQQWWFYLVATQTSTIAGTPRHETTFTLLPGMRFKLPGRVFESVGTGLWYFFADVTVPMTGPQTFSYQPIFAILHDY